MSSFKFVTLALATLLSVHTALGEEAKPSWKRVSCLKEMNAVRESVGFAAFKEDKIFGDAESGDELDPIPEGTQAVFPLSADKEDCAAAVEFWKKGFALFEGSLPPAFSASTKPYTDPQSVSFVSLLNPQANAVVDCAVLTYTNAASRASAASAPVEKSVIEEKSEEEKPKEEDKPKEDAAKKDDKAADKKEDGAKARRLSETPTYSLLCLTKPVALTANQRPFTEANWQAITDAMAAAASSMFMFPGFLTLAAASLGLLLM